MEIVTGFKVLAVLFMLLDILDSGICDDAVKAVKTADQCTPQQTHLSYGETTKEVVIMWSTVGQCSTMIKFGTEMWNLSQSVPGESRLFDDPSNKDGVKVIHKVKLRDLSPGQNYFYKPTSDGFSEGPFFFKIPAADTKEVQMLIISDVSATSPAIPAITGEAEKGIYAAILHTGNIAMNLSSANGTNGDNYLNRMGQAIKFVPYMTSPGPDETEADYAHYLHRFSMPQTGWPMTVDKMWYSIDVGPVHLISYSTEVFFTAGGKFSSMQHDWLIKDLKLANQNRDAVPWVIAFGHKPMYCSYENPDLTCSQKVSKIKSELEDIFYHYGADIIIQSYGGAYERSFPMYKGVSVNDNYTNPLGPVHIINGGASTWEMDYNFTSPSPGWSAFRYTNDSILTYGRLHVLNASLVEYEQVDKDGTIVDSFKITQEKHGQFSTDKLPANITAKIDKEVVDAGGKPGVLNIEEVGATDSKSKLSKLLEGDNRTRLIIGVSCAGVVVVAIIVIIFVKNMRGRRRNVSRRWEQMDINYGKKFYSKAPDKDEDNDFEIDMSDGTEPTRKLLNADD